MKLNVPIQTMIYFDSPLVNILFDDVHRTAHQIEIPIEFSSPVNKIEPAYISTSQYISRKPPKTAKEYLLVPQIKTDIKLPFYEYL